MKGVNGGTINSLSRRKNIARKGGREGRERHTLGTRLVEALDVSQPQQKLVHVALRRGGSTGTPAGTTKALQLKHPTTNPHPYGQQGVTHPAPGALCPMTMQ